MHVNLSPHITLPPQTGLPSSDADELPDVAIPVASRTPRSSNVLRPELAVRHIPTVLVKLRQAVAAFNDLTAHMAVARATYPDAESYNEMAFATQTTRARLVAALPEKLVPFWPKDESLLWAEQEVAHFARLAEDALAVAEAGDTGKLAILLMQDGSTTSQLEGLVHEIELQLAR